MNVNRLVWNNGFTNDKRAHSNKEPFKRKCRKCKKMIWLKPDRSGWAAYDTNNQPHVCKKPKKPKNSKPRAYKKQCKHCHKEILMKFNKGKWQVLETTGERHRCDSRTDEEILDTELLSNSPLDK